MARLQILELPSGADDDRPPFILVIDEWDVDTLETNAMLTEYWDAFGKKIGARGVLFADRTIDIPANDTSAYLAPAAKQEFVVELNGDPDAIRAAIAADMQKMRDANEGTTTKPRRDWCCSLAFQTLGKQHIDDCKQGAP